MQCWIFQEKQTNDFVEVKGKRHFIVENLDRKGKMHLKESSLAECVSDEQGAFTGLTENNKELRS